MLPLILGHGGTLTTSATTSQATHVIVGFPGGLGELDVAQCAGVHRAGLPLLQPHWVYESVQAGRLLPEPDFAVDVTQVFGLVKLLASTEPHAVKVEAPPPTTAAVADENHSDHRAKRARIDTDTGAVYPPDQAAVVVGPVGDATVLPQYLKDCFFVFDKPRTIMRLQPFPASSDEHDAPPSQATNLVSNLTELGATVLVVVSELSDDPMDAGGDCTDGLSEAGPLYDPACTHVIVDVQAGVAYNRAVKDGKLLVSSLWVDELVDRQAYVEPTLAIHGPLKGYQGVKGCAGMAISLSSYVLNFNLATTFAPLSPLSLACI